MVSITIFVEGGGKTAAAGNPAALTVGGSANFREGFHKLFVQEFPETQFDLKIRPFGSVTQAHNTLKTINQSSDSAALLIDLDGPPSSKAQRIQDNYPNTNTDRLFFMVQCMESWILSQPERIEEFGQQQHLIRQKPGVGIETDSGIAGKVPQEIPQADRVLRTLLQRFFQEPALRPSLKPKKKKYNKRKDGPALIGLLNLSMLKGQFEEVERLVKFLKDNS